MAALLVAAAAGTAAGRVSTDASLGNNVGLAYLSLGKRPYARLTGLYV